MIISLSEPTPGGRGSQNNFGVQVIGFTSLGFRELEFRGLGLMRNRMEEKAETEVKTVRITGCSRN